MNFNWDTEGLLDYQVFEHMMLNSDIDDIHKYYNDDGEVDLEDNYAGDSDDDACAIAQTINKYTHLNEQENVNKEVLDCHMEFQSNDHFDEPGVQRVTEELQAFHEDISAKARQILDRQPLSTQIILADQAVSIFKSYEQHGSQARLSQAVMDFLCGGDIVRQQGSDSRDVSKDGKLRLIPNPPKPNSRKSSGGSSKRKAEQQQHAEKPVYEKRSKISNLEVNRDPFLYRDRTPSDGSDSTSSFTQYGPMTATAMSFDSLRLTQASSSVHQHDLAFLQSTRSRSDMILNPIEPQTTIPHGRPIIIPRSPSTIASRSPSPPDLQLPPFDPDLFTITVDHESNALLKHTDFNPIHFHLRWPLSSPSDPDTLIRTAPIPGHLDSLNRLAHLFNLKAQHLLSHLLRKYGPQPHRHRHLHDDAHSSTIEPPHALFRLGITQYIQTMFEDCVRSRREQDPLGLTPEVRSLLKEVFETLDGGTSSVPSQPSRSALQQQSRKIETLNPLERAVLARACNVGTETVDAFWTDMTFRRRGWAALKTWCDAQDARVVRWAKMDGRW